MKMRPDDQPSPAGLSLGKGIQIIILVAMAFALFYRYSDYVSSHTNIPPEGDPVPKSTRSVPTPYYGN